MSKMLSLSLEFGIWVIGLQNHLRRRELGDPKGSIFSRSRGSESWEGLSRGLAVAVLLKGIF